MSTQLTMPASICVLQCLSFKLANAVTSLELMQCNKNDSVWLSKHIRRRHAVFALKSWNACLGSQPPFKMMHYHDTARLQGNIGKYVERPWQEPDAQLTPNFSRHPRLSARCEWRSHPVIKAPDWAIAQFQTPGRLQELTSWAQPTCRIVRERVNCYFRLLSFGVLYFMAIDNQNIYSLEKLVCCLYWYIHYWLLDEKIKYRGVEFYMKHYFKGKIFMSMNKQELTHLFDFQITLFLIC